MMMSILDYAKHTGLSDKVVRSFVLKGKLPAMRIGIKWWVHTEKADKVLENECQANIKTVTTVSATNRIRKGESSVDLINRKKAELMAKCRKVAAV